jgi:hypothetical protein
MSCAPADALGTMNRSVRYTADSPWYWYRTAPQGPYGVPVPRPPGGRGPVPVTGH